MDYSALAEQVRGLGAYTAGVVDLQDVRFDRAFRAMCETNACGNYGKCWMCPPYIGEIHQLMDTVRSFPRGLWFQTISDIEDSYDIEGMFEAGAKHAQVSRCIREKVAPLLKKPVLLLSCGGCHLCEVCAKREDQPCRFPDQALSSLEGYGVDVYNTTKDTDLKYINGQNTVTYFGIVLFSE